MAEFFKQGGDKWCYRPKKTKKKKVDYAKRHMSDWTMDTPEVVDFIECGGDIWALLGPDKAPTQLVIDPSPAWIEPDDAPIYRQQRKQLIENLLNQ